MTSQQNTQNDEDFPKEIPKKYNAKEQEQTVRKFWEKQHVFKFDEDTAKPVFSIDTPPPTLSGRMHVGHASSYTQQDIIARFKRMNGFEVFYPFGTDDNGLATEKLVQKEKKVNLRKVPRDEAIKICLEYLDENRAQFIQDWKDIGMSCDFDLYYSTINDHCRKISQKTFLDLVKQKRAYRKEAPVIWDTQFQSAIAQAELEDIERKSFFNDILFKLEEGTKNHDGSQHLTIGTTRPELLGACVAIFAHPDDKRYQPLFGKHAYSPIYNVKVPILPDENADPEKGTGAVMCCTFGDLTDVEWYKKHNLPLKVVITPDGKMNASAGKYEGMRIEDARKEIIADLKEAGLLTNQKEITQIVNVGERSGRPIEIINSKQWYIKYLDQKEDFLKGSEELNWNPSHMKHRLDNWVKGLNWDWSISRQRHYGIPIPAWYDKEGNVYYADESQLPVDPLSDRPLGVPESIELIPETDVFDTWFTSSSTPFLATELLADKPIHKKLFPMDLRPQAHDIINFWLFYTMAKTRLLHNNTNPWKATTISGWVLDPKGQKMSKSKGNIVRPQDVMEKYSGDAIRFWAANSKLGDDFPYMEKDLQTANKLVTKLWNASKFAHMFLSQADNTSLPKNESKTNPNNTLEAFDNWILAKLDATIQEATDFLDKFEYARAKRSIESFFWNDLCDNYLEIVKDRLYKPEIYGEDAKQSGIYTVNKVFQETIKLFAPFVPYITEVVYQLFFKEFTLNPPASIHRAEWPKQSNTNADDFADRAVEIIQETRRQKADAGISLATELKQLNITVQNCDKIDPYIADIKGATKAHEIICEEGPFAIKFTKA